jgi:two-component system, NtrC family, response regulator
LNSILIIDDEEKLRTLLARIISLEGFEVLQAGDCRTGMLKLEQLEVGVVLCDVKLPDGNGLELAGKIKEKYPLVEVILLTAYGNIPDGVQAIKNGAFDYITKGDDNSRIIPLLYRALEKVELAKRVQQLEKRLGDRHSFDSIVGQSPAVQQAIELARRVAGTDTTILLTGETGTGKEVFAQAIHQASRRHRHNFVAVNCSAFSKELLESELFGHRAGAFTGATRDQKGLFEEAHQGTLFLDEIGEMPLDLQAKLLRVIETGEFLRVGDTRPTRVQVRLLAATNRDLPREVERGHFREDLYYRISVFQIRLPALRERVADIPALARHFLSLFASKTNKRIRHLSAEFLQALVRHPWRGNIRELKNVIERSVIMADGDELTAALLPPDMQIESHSAQPDGTLSAFGLASAEKLHIQKVLNHTNGNKTRAAELLGIALTTLYRKLSEYGIS